MKSNSGTSAADDEEYLDRALPHAENKSLREAWRSQAGWNLPPSWEGPDSMLAKFYRQLNTRQHHLFKVVGLQTQVSATNSAAGEEKAPHQ